MCKTVLYIQSRNKEEEPCKQELVCVRACVRASVRACVCACVRVPVCDEAESTNHTNFGRGTPPTSHT